MKKYKAKIYLDDELQEVVFDTNDNPIEYLWARYGMDSFIEWLTEIAEPEIEED